MRSACDWEAPTAEEAIATLVNIASLDREEEEIVSLPRIIGNSVGGVTLMTSTPTTTKAFSQMSKLLQDITEATRKAVASLVQEQTDADGRVSLVSKLNFFNMGKKEPWMEALEEAGFPKVDPEPIKPLFEYLEFCLQQVCCGQ